MIDPRRKAYFNLHIAILLFGITAILGRLISLHEAPLVWHRLWITCVSLLLIPGVIGHIRRLSRKSVLQFAGVGCIVCLHWLSFYGSIKYSNVSVALSALATASLFTSLLEPLIMRKRLGLMNFIEIALGILVIIGIWIIFSVAELYRTGMILGLISAFLAALFATLNKKIVGDHNVLSMTFVELGSGFILLSLAMPFYLQYFPGEFWPGSSDWVYLLILALACTSLAYVLALGALKHLSAFTSSLSINLEPVYGILMAAFLFHEYEKLSIEFYIGTILILLSVFLHPLLNRILEKYQKADI